jgi:transposase
MSGDVDTTFHRDARIALLEAQLAEAQAAVRSRDLLIETLRVQLARMKRMAFGPSSEKLGEQIAQLELALEELEAEAEAEATMQAPDTATPPRPAPVRALPAHLPRVEQTHEPASGACTCPDCGGPLRRLGEDADELLDVVPLSWRVIRHVRPKYSCRMCDRIVQAPTPPKPIAKGKATFATLAHVVVSKFDHHLPLYRQAEMMAAQGLPLDRSTLAGWTGQAAVLLDPVVARIRALGLEAGKLHTDDTPVPMLDPGRGRTATGRLWVYAADDRACGSTSPPLVWYRFTPDRSGKHPQTELAAFTGFLQADAYAGYARLYEQGRVVEIACWAHFRRKIYDEHQNNPTALTTDMLARIAALYAVEAHIAGQPPGERARVRRERSGPIVEDLRRAIDRALAQLSPKASMAVALRYGRKLWPSLTRFLDHGEVEIDNGVAERALRGVAVGRRNWLFAGSIKGGERAAAIYSAIETAKLNGVEPQAWLTDILTRIGEGWPASRLDELMPWNWQAAAERDRLAA